MRGQQPRPVVGALKPRGRRGARERLRTERDAQAGSRSTCGSSAATSGCAHYMMPVLPRVWRLNARI